MVWLLQLWLWVFREWADLMVFNFCTDVGDAFSFFVSKNANVMRIYQNEHKTYSIVLMYIRFCGATYIIMTKQFTGNGGG